MNNQTDKDYLKLAVEQAKKSVELGGFPAGSIIVNDNTIIAEGISIGFLKHDPTWHSDTAAIREACNKLQKCDLEGAVLYSSIEGCNMCFSVAYWAGISKIVYACRKTPEMVQKKYYEGFTSNTSLNDDNSRRIELVFIPDFEEEYLQLIKSWEESYV